eukprot:SM000012S25395  [mRNA]  locus=s12:835250:837441:- [translate_table: standard]
MGGGAFFEDLFAAPSAWPPVPPQAGLARGSPFVPAAVDLLRRQPAAARPQRLAGERKLARVQPRATKKDKGVAAHDGDGPHIAAHGLGARRPAETGRPVVVPVHWLSSKFSGEASTSSAQRSEQSKVSEVVKDKVSEVVKESKPQVVPVPVKEGKGDADGPSVSIRLRMEPPAAATKIQAAFRGRAVRASRPLQQLRKLVSLAGSLKDLQTSWETEDKQLLRTDAKVGRRWAELVMSHLLQLDSIQTTNASVRQRRRELVKAAVAFQEAIDAAVSSNSSQAAFVETPETEPSVEVTSGLEPSSPAKDLVTEYASNASIAHEVEPSHQEPDTTCEPQVPEVPEGAESGVFNGGNTMSEAEASKTGMGVTTEPPACSHQLAECQPLESQGPPSTSVEQKAEVLSNSDTVVAQPVEAAADHSNTAAETELSADAVPIKPEGLCTGEQEETADVAANLADKVQQQEKEKAMLKLTSDLYQAALSRSLSEVKALKLALAQQCGGQVPHVSDLKTGHRAGHSHLQLPSNPHQALSSNLSR